MKTTTFTRSQLVHVLVILFAFPLLADAQTPTGKQFDGRRIMAGQCYGDATRSGEFMENVISIKLLPGKTEQDIAAIMSAYGAAVIDPFDAYQWGRVEIGTGHNFYDAVADFEADPSVQYAEPLYVNGGGGGGGLPLNEPDDPYYTGAIGNYNHHWGFDNTGQDPPSGTADADIYAPEAWVLSTGEPDVLMAVLDSGFPVDQQTDAFLHPDLDDPARYFLIETFYPLTTPYFRDDTAHGTHVAGILGAESNNGIGVTGVNW